MAKVIKFTFKKRPSAGRYSSFYPSSTEIKLNGKVFGHISENETHDGWSISFAVKVTPKDNPNCDWSWRNFKKVFKTEAEAREWINKFDVIKYIMDKYELHCFE